MGSNGHEGGWKGLTWGVAEKCRGTRTGRNLILKPNRYIVAGYIYLTNLRMRFLFMVVLMAWA